MTRRTYRAVFADGTTAMKKTSRPVTVAMRATYRLSNSPGLVTVVTFHSSAGATDAEIGKMTNRGQKNGTWTGVLTFVEIVPAENA